MTEDKLSSVPANDLRKRAEEIARANEGKKLESLPPEETRHVLHELRVHQIELEMQNEELRRAQGALEASRAQYFDLYDLAPVGYFTLSEKGLILEVNFTVAALLGVTRANLIKQPIAHFIFSEDQDVYYKHNRRLFQTGSPQMCELRMLRENADPFWARLDATVVHDADRAHVARVVVSDINERKTRERETERLNRLYSSLSVLNQTVVRAKSREELFGEVCRIATELAGFKLTWIGWPDSETHQVNAVARAGDNQHYVDKITVYSDDRPEGRGPTGTCIREGKTCVVNDFLSEPLTAPWHAAAAAHGLRAAAALPIYYQGEVRGAMTVYESELDVFQEKEIALLEESAAAISLALERLDYEVQRQRAEEEILQKNSLLSAQQEASIDGILAVDGDDKIILFNRRFGEMWNVPPELIEAGPDAPVLRWVQGLVADPNAFLEKVRHLYAHRCENSRDEIALIDGRVFDRYSAPMFGPDDRYFGRVWYFRDITERKLV